MQRTLSRMVPEQLKQRVRSFLGVSDWRPMEASAAEWDMISRFKPYTMTGENRIWALIKAIEYVAQNAIEGDLVETGVWRGGNVMVMKHIINKSEPIGSRKYWLFDTFTGMAIPGEHDTTPGGRDAMRWYEERNKGDHVEWCYASLSDVRNNFDVMNLNGPDLKFIQGKTQETLRVQENLPEKISLLRLDTDFYESTKAELEALYPRLTKGGVLILDDYGAWLGHRKAVDDYFGSSKPLLIPIDRACRVAIKV